MNVNASRHILVWTSQTLGRSSQILVWASQKISMGQSNICMGQAHCIILYPIVPILYLYCIYFVSSLLLVVSCHRLVGLALCL